MLAFVAGQFDMTFPYEVTVPNMKDIKSQMPNAVCEIAPTNFAPNLLMNAQAAFRQSGAAQGGGDDDRSSGLCRHPRRGQRRYRHGRAAGARRTVGDAEGDARACCRATPPMSRNRAKRPARSCSRLVMGRTNTSRLKIAARNLPDYRDAASLLIDQLKADLYRRRTRTGRNRELAAEANTLGFRPGAECGGRRHRRPGPDLL